MKIKRLTSTIARLIGERFGYRSLMDTGERHLRILEEAIELCQTSGITPEQVDTVKDYVFSRPVGETHQELAGVFVSLLASFYAHQLDPEHTLVQEIERLQAVPKEESLEKQRLKNLSGITKYGG